MSAAEQTFGPFKTTERAQVVPKKDGRHHIRRPSELKWVGDATRREWSPTATPSRGGENMLLQDVDANDDKYEPFNQNGYGLGAPRPIPVHEFGIEQPAFGHSPLTQTVVQSPLAQTIKGQPMNGETTFIQPTFIQPKSPSFHFRPEKPTSPQSRSAQPRFVTGGSSSSSAHFSQAQARGSAMPGSPKQQQSEKKFKVNEYIDRAVWATGDDRVGSAERFQKKPKKKKDRYFWNPLLRRYHRIAARGGDSQDSDKSNCGTLSDSLTSMRGAQKTTDTAIKLAENGWYAGRTGKEPAETEDPSSPIFRVLMHEDARRWGEVDIDAKTRPSDKKMEILKALKLAPQKLDLRDPDTELRDLSRKERDLRAMLNGRTSIQKYERERMAMARDASMLQINQKSAEKGGEFVDLHDLTNVPKLVDDERGGQGKNDRAARGKQQVPYSPANKDWTKRMTWTERAIMGKPQTHTTDELDLSYFRHNSVDSHHKVCKSTATMYSKISRNPFLRGKQALKMIAERKRAEAEETKETVVEDKKDGLQQKLDLLADRNMQRNVASPTRIDPSKAYRIADIHSPANRDMVRSPMASGPNPSGASPIFQATHGNGKPIKLPGATLRSELGTNAGKNDLTKEFSIAREMKMRHALEAWLDEPQSRKHFGFFNRVMAGLGYGDTSRSISNTETTMSKKNSQKGTKKDLLNSNRRDLDNVSADRTEKERMQSIEDGDILEETLTDSRQLIDSHPSRKRRSAAQTLDYDSASLVSYRTERPIKQPEDRSIISDTGSIVADSMNTTMLNSETETDGLKPPDGFKPPGKGKPFVPFMWKMPKLPSDEITEDGEVMDMNIGRMNSDNVNEFNYKFLNMDRGTMLDEEGNLVDLNEYKIEDDGESSLFVEAPEFGTHLFRPNISNRGIKKLKKKPRRGEGHKKADSENAFNEDGLEDEHHLQDEGSQTSRDSHSSGEEHKTKEGAPTVRDVNQTILKGMNLSATGKGGIAKGKSTNLNFWGRVAYHKQKTNAKWKRRMFPQLEDPSLSDSAIHAEYRKHNVTAPATTEQRSSPMEGLGKSDAKKPKGIHAPFEAACREQDDLHEDDDDEQDPQHMGISRKHKLLEEQMKITDRTASMQARAKPPLLTTEKLMASNFTLADLEPRFPRVRSNGWLKVGQNLLLSSSDKSSIKDTLTLKCELEEGQMPPEDKLSGFALGNGLAPLVLAADVMTGEVNLSKTEETDDLPPLTYSMECQPFGPNCNSQKGRLVQIRILEKPGDPEKGIEGDKKKTKSNLENSFDNPKRVRIDTEDMRSSDFRRSTTDFLKRTDVKLPNKGRTCCRRGVRKVWRYCLFEYVSDWTKDMYRDLCERVFSLKRKWVLTDRDAVGVEVPVSFLGGISLGIIRNDVSYMDLNDLRGNRWGEIGFKEEIAAPKSPSESQLALEDAAPENVGTFVNGKYQEPERDLGNDANASLQSGKSWRQDTKLRLAETVTHKPNTREDGTTKLFKGDFLRALLGGRLSGLPISEQVEIHMWFLWKILTKGGVVEPAVQLPTSVPASTPTVSPSKIEMGVPDWPQKEESVLANTNKVPITTASPQTSPQTSSPKTAGGPKATSSSEKIRVPVRSNFFIKRLLEGSHSADPAEDTQSPASPKQSRPQLQFDIAEPSEPTAPLGGRSTLAIEKFLNDTKLRRTQSLAEVFAGDVEEKESDSKERLCQSGNQDTVNSRSSHTQGKRSDRQTSFEASEWSQLMSSESSGVDASQPAGGNRHSESTDCFANTQSLLEVFGEWESTEKHEKGYESDDNEITLKLSPSGTKGILTNPRGRGKSLMWDPGMEEEFREREKTIKGAMNKTRIHESTNLRMRTSDSLADPLEELQKLRDMIEMDKFKKGDSSDQRIHEVQFAWLWEYGFWMRKHAFYDDPAMLEALDRMKNKTYQTDGLWTRIDDAQRTRHHESYTTISERNKSFKLGWIGRRKTMPKLREKGDIREFVQNILECIAEYFDVDDETLNKIVNQHRRREEIALEDSKIENFRMRNPKRNQFITQVADRRRSEILESPRNIPPSPAKSDTQVNCVVGQGGEVRLLKPEEVACRWEGDGTTTTGNIRSGNRATGTPEHTNKAGQKIPVDTVTRLQKYFLVKKGEVIGDKEPRAGPTKAIPIETLPGSVILADDLSVWVNGERVRTRFDARYTDLGRNFLEKQTDEAKKMVRTWKSLKEAGNLPSVVRPGQVLGIFVTKLRLTLYLDDWPLLTYRFGTQDVDYQKCVSDDSTRLSAEVWPIVQMCARHKTLADKLFPRTFGEAAHPAPQNVNHEIYRIQWEPLGKIKVFPAISEPNRFSLEDRYESMPSEEASNVAKEEMEIVGRMHRNVLAQYILLCYRSCEGQTGVSPMDLRNEIKRKGSIFKKYSKERTRRGSRASTDSSGSRNSMGGNSNNSTNSNLPTKPDTDHPIVWSNSVLAIRTSSFTRSVFPSFFSQENHRSSAAAGRLLAPANSIYGRTVAPRQNYPRRAVGSRMEGRSSLRELRQKDAAERVIKSIDLGQKGGRIRRSLKITKEGDGKVRLDFCDRYNNAEVPVVRPWRYVKPEIDHGKKNRWERLHQAKMFVAKTAKNYKARKCAEMQARRDAVDKDPKIQAMRARVKEDKELVQRELYQRGETLAEPESSPSVLATPKRRNTLELIEEYRDVGHVDEYDPILSVAETLRRARILRRWTCRRQFCRVFVVCILLFIAVWNIAILPVQRAKENYFQPDDDWFVFSPEFGFITLFVALLYIIFYGWKTSVKDFNNDHLDPFEDSFSESEDG